LDASQFQLLMLLMEMQGKALLDVDDYIHPTSSRLRGWTQAQDPR
jgi:hypothetical protein